MSRSILMSTILIFQRRKFIRKFPEGLGWGGGVGGSGPPVPLRIRAIDSKKVLIKRIPLYISMGESNTVVSAYTMYRHVQQYCSHPSICIYRLTDISSGKTHNLRYFGIPVFKSLCYTH